MLDVDPSKNEGRLLRRKCGVETVSSKVLQHAVVSCCGSFWYGRAQAFKNSAQGLGETPKESITAVVAAKVAAVVAAVVASE